MNDQPNRELLQALKPAEIWFRHPVESDLWIGENGVLINSAALIERETYYDVARLPAGERPASSLAPEIFAGLLWAT